MKRSHTQAQHQFSQVPSANIQRSVFNRTHCHKSTFMAGQLIPFLVDEALPGDTFNVRAHLMARLATPIVPIMDNLYLDSFYFAVPYRLLWSHWANMNGEQFNPGDSTSFITPVVRTSGHTYLNIPQLTLGDYFGLPIGVNMAGGINALAFRAYNLIYNQWFRDENLCQSAVINTDDGPDAYSAYPIQIRGKRHDYFTSCLPWPQKGTAVTLPIGAGTLPVHGDGNAMGLSDGTQSFGIFQNAAFATSLDVGGTRAEGAAITGTIPSLTNKLIGFGYAPGLVADISSVAAVTINSLRQAFQLQHMYERDARGGTRLTEIIRSHFGVISPDARMQRPEYLGGSSQRLIINPVAQTSETNTSVSPQGNLAGFGVVHDGKGGFHHSFTEHCVIIGILNVRADLTYQQGIPRMFSRSTRFDYYWPALAHLGEQAVLNQEIYSDGSANDLNVFGYQERYAEYRYFPSKVTGMFRSTSSLPLHVWHLAQYYTGLPALNTSFIQENPPVSRIIAVPGDGVTTPQFLFDSFIEMKCARPMPVYSVPGLIDHF